MARLNLKYKLFAILAVSFLVTIAASFVILSSLDKAKEDASVLNAMGRQRMLTQAMGKSALGYAMAKSRLKSIEQSTGQIDKYITQMRTIYTKSVIKVAKKIELGISINPSGEEHPAVPFPATFARLVNENFRKGSNLSVNIISEHPVNPVQNLNSDVDREANEHLKNSKNKMFSKVVERSGKLYVQMYTADRATAQACVSCHTQLMGKAFKLNDLLGIRKYEMVFSSDLEIGREEIQPKLDEYEKAKKIFSQTLMAFKNGGSYPLDLNLTKFKKTKPIIFKSVKNSIKNIEYSYNVFIASIDRLLDSQVNSLDYRIAQSEILKNSNDLRFKSNELVSVFTKIANENQKNIRSIVLISSLLTLIILLLLGFYLTTFVIKPIQKLTGVLGEIKDGNFDVESLPVKSSDEIGSLNDACNKMVVNMNILVDQAKDIEEGNLNAEKVLESLKQGREFDEASNFVELKYQVTQGTLAEAFDDLTTKMRKLAVQAIAIAEDNLDSPVLKEKFSGDLGDAFTKMIEKMNDTATQAQYIANNDLHNKNLNSEGKGTLTGSMSTMVKNLRQMESEKEVLIENIIESAQTLASSSEELAAVSSQMNNNAEDTAKQSMIVSSASEEVSGNIETVATGTEEMAASIKEIAENSAKAAQIASSAVQTVQKTNTIISKLGDSSEEIGQVIKVINSIAEQTNLLALNATIEAARAGEAGKGFAVVANEVKDLAKETSKATEDISKKIDAIQTDTSEAVNSITDITTVINEVNDISATIASAVEEQSATTTEMRRNVMNASQGSVEISKNIASVTEAAKNTNAGATDTEASAADLTKLAGKLQNLVEQFKA